MMAIPAIVSSENWRYGTATSRIMHFRPTLPEVHSTSYLEFSDDTIAEKRTISAAISDGEMGRFSAHSST